MVEEVTTEYVALIDVDDIWYPNKLEEQIPFLGLYDIIGSKCQYFGDSNIIPDIPDGDISSYDFFLQNPIINSSAVLRKTLLIYNISEITGLEDYELWLRLRYIIQAKFYNVPHVLVGHRIHNNSAFNNINNNYLPEFLMRKKVEYSYEIATIS